MTDLAVTSADAVDAVDASTAADGPSCCPSGGAGLSAPDALRVAAVLKALADPVRLRLYSRIAAADDAVCVCDIDDVGVSQPTVSHHLRKLREAGLIDCERRGTWVHYWVVPGATDAARALLGVDGATAVRGVVRA